MNDKTQITNKLRDEFGRWEEFLGRLSEEQISAPKRIDLLSIKDIMAHLTTWQQITVARLEAALYNREPEYPGWPAGLDPESDGDLDQINAWIYESHYEKPWVDIYREWRERFLRYMELAEAIPEKDLLEVGRYRWIEGYPLSAVLLGSYEHHEEHLEALQGLVHQGKIR